MLSTLAEQEPTVTSRPAISNRFGIIRLVFIQDAADVSPRVKA